MQHPTEENLTSAPFSALMGDLTSSSSAQQAPGQTAASPRFVSEGLAAVLCGFVAILRRAVQARWQHGQRIRTVAYFAGVLSVRLFLRSSYGVNMHWIVTMVIEDFLSILSFAIAVMHLHLGQDGQGLSLSALAKQMSPTSPRRSPREAASMEMSSASPAQARLEDVRLLHFAM